MRQEVTVKDMEKKQKFKSWKLLEFYTPIEEKFSDGDDFIIRGVAINETTTLNNVKYVAEELEKAAHSFRNVPILLDHVNAVKNIVGRTTERVIFNPQFRRIEFEGKIMDKEIIEMIRDSRIGSVSIGAKVQDLIEEEDGTMKAVGIQGLEISLVAVPGDNQANLAQAIQRGLVLKEKAKLSDELNTETKKMAEDEIIQEPVEPVETSVEPKEEVAEEKVEKVEKVKNINVKVDTTELSEMKKQIAELKELLVEKKKIKEQAEEKEEEVEDETKGEVSTETDEKLSNVNNRIVETMGKGTFSIYRDYSMEDVDTTTLKRLIR